jgi:4-diphosphocytidyl-2-C-methyl-D-erythritol kinase
MRSRVPAVDELAPAKVNLDLCVLTRRSDGYHDLDSVVVFVELADRLIFEPGDGLRLEIAGPFASALADEPRNLVLGAAALLAERAAREAGVLITLEKHIPVAAGLGGGSADAAATLRGLNRLWDLGLDGGELQPLALRLGADVPVCLESRPARIRGIGERLEPLSGVFALPLLLVNPGVPVPTAAVFAGLGGRFAAPPPGPPPVFLDTGHLLGWLRARANHLEAPARGLAPAIGHALAALRAQPGCALARMSGSGATCFGLFEEPFALHRAEAAIRAREPGWWLQATRIRS